MVAKQEDATKDVNRDKECGRCQASCSQVQSQENLPRSGTKASPGLHEELARTRPEGADY